MTGKTIIKAIGAAIFCWRHAPTRGTWSTSKGHSLEGVRTLVVQVGGQRLQGRQEYRHTST